MGDLTALVTGLGLLAANAFFVGAEFALVSARRTQVEQRAAEGSRMARTTLWAMDQVSYVMAGAQLGITAASLGLGAVAEPAVAQRVEPALHALGLPANLLHPVAFAIALALVVYLHVVLGEMVPKNIALAGPERAAIMLGPPMMTVVRALKPVVAALNAVANGVVRLLGVQPRDDVPSAFTREEVGSMVDESRAGGLLHEEEHERLSNALFFTERSIGSIMRPRDQLATVGEGATVADVEQLCAETGFTRFPVQSEAGELTGYLHVKDVLETDPQRQHDVIEQRWVRPFATVRPGDLLDDALTTLRRRGAHMARVVDEDGVVVGVVTLDDVLEELVGDIR
ncbi:MAG: hemolysin family protein [Nocardioidaceae bacterium]